MAKKATNKKAAGNNKKNAPKKQNFFVRTIHKIVDFCKGSVVELKKVTWLTKDELTKQTGAVLFLVAVCTVFIWVLDTGLGFLRGLLM